MRSVRSRWTSRSASASTRTFNPTFDVNSPFCQVINRVANDGALGNILLTYLNNGAFETSGMDPTIDWAFDLGPGRFSLNSVVGYLFDLKSKELPNDPLIDYAGSLGPQQNQLNAGAFEWKMFNTFGYTIGQWTAILAVAAPAEHPLGELSDQPCDDALGGRQLRPLRAEWQLRDHEAGPGARRRRAICSTRSRR